MIDRRNLLRGLAAGSACVATAGLSACSLNNANSHKGANAIPVSWCKYRTGAFKTLSLDPAAIDSKAAQIACSLLFDTLVSIDTATGAVEPLAAASFEVSTDAQSVTFHLPEGVTFHNDEPVDAQSFKRAWERLVAPLALDNSKSKDALAEDLPHYPFAHLLAHVKGYNELYAGKTDTLAGVSCPNAQTLKVELSCPYADWVSITAHPALSPVPQSTLTSDDFATFPYGNGPFRIKQAWNGKKDIHLSAYKGYVGGEANIEGVLLVPESDTTTAFKQFEAGNLDVCDVPVDQYAKVMAEEGVAQDGCTVGPGGRLLKTDEPVTLMLACNAAATPFNISAFRRAIAFALDREGLCEKSLRGMYADATGLVPPCLLPELGGASVAWNACSYDPEHAEELLAEAQNTMGEDPEPLSFNLLYRASGVQARIAEQVARDLNAVGISIKLEGLEAEDLSERLEEGDFDLALVSAAPEVPRIQALLQPVLYGSNQGLVEDAGAADLDAVQSNISADLDSSDTSVEFAEGADSSVLPIRSNPSAYASPEVDALFEQAAHTLDASERANFYVQVLAMAGEDMPVIPLVHPLHIKLASECVTHLVITSGGIPELAHAVL